MALSARRAAFAEEEREGPGAAEYEEEEEEEDLEEEVTEPVLPSVGTPGPGAYDLPSCFRPRHHRVAAVESAFVLSTGVAATIKGRHFLPDPSDPKPGPGPQHYLPQLAYDSSHVRSPTMLFTMASRVKNQRLYISPSFNVDLLGKDSPGPGTYRVGWGRRPGRQAPGPRNYGAATFGTGPQRPGPAREALAVPGPIYDVNASTSPRPTGPRWAADVGQAHREAHQAKLAAKQQQQQQQQQQQRRQQRVTASCGGGRRAISAPGSADVASDAAETDGAAAAAEEDAAAKAAADGGAGDMPPAEGRPLSADITAAGAEGKDSHSKAEGRLKPGKLQVSEEHKSSSSSSRWYGKPAIGDATTPKAPVAVFGTEKISAQRTAKVYLCKELTDNDPALSDSPGPVYYPAAACMAGQVRPGPRWSGAPRHPAAKEPYIGKLHAQATAGDCSPGPAAYNVRNEARGVYVAAERRCGSPLDSLGSSSHSSCGMRAGNSLLGDGRSMRFGSGQRLAPLELPSTSNPGPGAYNVLQDKSSTQRTAPSFSLGVDLRSVSPGPSDASRRSPGPGSCDAPPGVGSKGAPYSPAFSLRGRLEHGGIVAKSTTPGPGTYDPRTGLADGWRALSSSMADSSSSSLPEADGGIGTERPRTRGYTMGGKLPASDETPSPGPAAYVVNEALTKHHSGAAVLTSRAVAHQYISPLHEQSEAGACSPGPAAYQVLDPAVSSTHSQGGAFSFGTGPRTDMAKTRF